MGLFDILRVRLESKSNAILFLNLCLIGIQVRSPKINLALFLDTLEDVKGKDINFIALLAAQLKVYNSLTPIYWAQLSMNNTAQRYFLDYLLPKVFPHYMSQQRLDCLKSVSFSHSCIWRCAALSIPILTDIPHIIAMQSLDQCNESEDILLPIIRDEFARKEVQSWLSKKIPSIKNLRSPQVRILMELALCTGSDPSRLYLCKAMLQLDTISGHYFTRLLDACADCEEKAKLFFYVGGKLSKQQFEEGSLFLIRFLESAKQISEHQIDVISATFFKASDHVNCRLALAKGVQLFPGNRDFIDKFCCLPIGQDFKCSQYSDIVWKACFPKLLTMRTSIFESLVERPFLLELRHSYYLTWYRDAPMGKLFEESKSLDDNRFYQAWSFALDICHTLPDCLAHGSNSKHKYTEAMNGGLFATALFYAKEHLKELEHVLKSLKSHDFIVDSVLSLLIVDELQAISKLYRLLGCWKPTRAFLAKALELSKSMWPHRSHRSLNDELYFLDMIATGTSDLVPMDKTSSMFVKYKSFDGPSIHRPFLYSGNTIDDLSNDYENFVNCSPFMFSRWVWHRIRSRSVSSNNALALLILSNWLPFHRRDLADRIDQIKDAEVALSFEEWPGFMEEAGEMMENDMLLLTLDTDDSNLIIASKQAILVSPIPNYSEILDQINAILEENKAVLFKKSSPDDPEFKRNWWCTRKKLDTQVAQLSLKIDQDWLTLLRGLFSTASASDISSLKCAINTNLGLDVSDGLAEFIYGFGPTLSAKTLDSLISMIESTTCKEIEEKSKVHFDTILSLYQYC